MTVELNALPKAELHIHIEGALRPELVFQLAERNGIALPWDDVAELESEYEFSDLVSFLGLYYRCMDVLRTSDDFRDLVRDYAAHAGPQGVRHAELFFDPQAHTSRGVAIDTVIDGLLAGLEDAHAEHGLTGGLILCFVRDRPVAEAMETLESVAGRAHQLIGVGLDSAEVGFPPELFEDVYRRAAELGLHLVAHAGEEGPADYIRTALDVLHVERVDHGVRVLEDQDLVDRMARERIPLTVCPLSNERLRVVQRMADHPLPAMMAAGLLVTVNSDDPAYFGGYAGDNFRALERHLGLTAEQLRGLAAASVEASFADSARKAELLDQISRRSTVPSAR